MTKSKDKYLLVVSFLEGSRETLILLIYQDKSNFFFKDKILFVETEQNS